MFTLRLLLRDVAECPSMTDVILRGGRMLRAGVWSGVAPRRPGRAPYTSSNLTLARYCRVPILRDPARGGGDHFTTGRKDAMEPGFSPSEIDTSRPHPTRLYNYYPGRRTSMVDREAAAEVLQGTGCAGNSPGGRALLRRIPVRAPQGQSLASWSRLARHLPRHRWIPPSGVIVALAP
jgi:hypothetical protein